MKLRGRTTEVIPMGLIDSLNPFSKSDDDTVDIDEDFEMGDEVDDSIEDDISEEDVGEADSSGEPDIPDEWDSAYKFADWYLSDEGFADMLDFGEKAMMYKLQNSPMYRDRIETGLGTMESIRSAKENLQAIRGEESESSDYEELADKVEDADRLISGIRSLSGEDELVVQQGMAIAQEAIGAIASKGSGSGGGGNVEADSRVVDDSIER